MQALALSIRGFETADYAPLAAMNNANFPEFMWTADEMRYEDAHRPAHCRSERWVAECDGRVVGMAMYDQSAGAYHPRKFMLEIVVDPAMHKRGIGARLYGVVIDALRGLDPIALDTWSREDMPCRLAFLAHRGFREDQRMWSSELDLTTFDPSPFRGYVDAVRSSGLVVRSLADLRAAGALDERELYDLCVEINADVPVPPSRDRTRRTFEDWRARELAHISAFLDGYFVAIDGTRYVGTTQLWHAPERDRLRTGLTGVRRAYRGRGIAFGLKVLALEMAKQRGYRLVDTENASSNAGMLSINDRLGFLRRPAWIHYAADWTAARGAAA